MKAHLITISVVFLIILFAVQAQTNEVKTVETLARKSGCFQCHSHIKKAICPTFHDIAVKYKKDSLAGDALFKSIRNGGRGNWAKISLGIPMPPYSGRLSDAEIRNLVVWVLDQ